VLTVVGRASSYELAIAKAYDAASRITFEGMQYRRDIGQKALAAQSGEALSSTAASKTREGPPE
jgi:phosphoribosylamine--glycine ligase